MASLSNKASFNRTSTLQCSRRIVCRRTLRCCSLRRSLSRYRSFNLTVGAMNCIQSGIKCPRVQLPVRMGTRLLIPSYIRVMFNNLIELDAVEFYVDRCWLRLKRAGFTYMYRRLTAGSHQRSCRNTRTANPLQQWPLILRLLGSIPFDSQRVFAFYFD